MSRPLGSAMTCCDSERCCVETQNPKILAVILDLDGTLLDTERATRGVLKEFLAKYGKVLDKAKDKRLGLTLKASAAATVKDYGLHLTPDQYIQQIIPMYQQKWMYAKALPGANRLIHHLYSHGVPFALASNSLQEYINLKISHLKGWKECFSVILGSDQVKAGKPSPDLYEEAAKRMGVDTIHCLVIEDSLVGVKAANAANMAVVAVPPQSEAVCSSLANTTLHSLLEFQPELWGLPPFEDWIGNALPIEPIYLLVLSSNGIVCEVTDPEDGTSALPDQVWGHFFGWVLVDMHETFKILVYITLDNRSCTRKKAVQVYALDGDSEYIPDHQPTKLMLVGYIRNLTIEQDAAAPETTPMNTELLEEYVSIAKASLDLPIFVHHSCMLGGHSCVEC